MLSKEYLEFISNDYYKDDTGRFEINKNLADMYKGKFKELLLKRISTEFKKESNQLEIFNRVLPINITKRVTDKIAAAYKEDPTRELEFENQTDQDIFSYYQSIIDFNEIGAIVDRYVNLHKECLVWPYFNLSKNVPMIKVLRPWQYKIYSIDKQNEESTDVVVIPDKFNSEDVFKIYTSDQIIITDKNGNVRSDIMGYYGNPEGINPYNKLPFIYVRNERDEAMTYPDESFKDMSLFIPILFGDLNYAIKYQAFGMIWGRNVNEELIERAPSAFLNLVAHDIDSNVPPEVGVIKPDVDISETLDSAVKQLGLWLNSRGIRPSAISSQGESFSSAISKMIDEADVTGIVTQNQKIYRKYEKDMFDYMLKYGHPVWNKEPFSQIPKTSFSFDNSVITTFKEPKPYLTINEVIDQQIKLLDASLVSKEHALRTIFPQFKDDKIQSMLAEVQPEQQPVETFNVE